MHHRSLATIISEAGPLRPTAALLLSALSHYRTVRWAPAARIIHCSPAPVTERPGVQTDFARPPVAPLEEAFVEAQSVKRAIEYRARSVAMENR